MSRDRTPYGDRAVRAVHVAGAVDVTTPLAGWYKIKLGKDTVLRAVRLVYGPPLDPITGEELDRSWRWMAYLDDGGLADFDVVWPKCAKDKITEAEFNRCCARTQWARQHAPESAWAERGKRLDPLSLNTPLPF